jgi:hypothetical protein
VLLLLLLLLLLLPLPLPLLLPPLLLLLGLLKNYHSGHNNIGSDSGMTSTTYCPSCSPVPLPPVRSNTTVIKY